MPLLIGHGFLVLKGRLMSAHGEAVGNYTSQDFLRPNGTPHRGMRRLSGFNDNIEHHTD
jgi:hypothetical protein